MKPGVVILIICLLAPQFVSADEITLVKHASRQASAAQTESYVVKPNDTLANIFIKGFKARPGDMPYLYKKFRELNPGVTNLNYIRSDQKLIIPRIQKTPPQVAAQKGNAVQAVEKDAYVIKQGEHLAQILRKVYGLSDEQIFREYMAAIKELNPEIKDPNIIHPGQKIRIPITAQTQAKKDTAQPAAPVSREESPALTPVLQNEAPSTSMPTPSSKPAAVPSPTQEPASAPAPAPVAAEERVQPKPAAEASAPSLPKLQPQPEPQPQPQPQPQPVPKPAVHPRPQPKPAAEPQGDIKTTMPPQLAEQPHPAPPVAPKPAKRAPVVSQTPLTPPIALKKPEPPRAPRNENVARLIRSTLFPAFKQMGASQRDQGTYFMPIAGGGNIAIDAQEIPVMELDTGNKIILDINGKISPELKGLIEKAFPSCKVITNPGPDLESMMDRVLSVSGYFSINKHASPLLVGVDEKVKLSGTWIVYKDYSRHNVFVINILKTDEHKTPKPIREYAARFGLDIIEMGGSDALPIKPVATPLRNLQHSYTALLDQLGVAYQRDQVIEIASLDKTLSITYKAPVLAGKVIITPELPDLTLQGLLKQKGFYLINAKEAVIKDVLDGLAIETEGPPIKLTIAQGRTEIDLPGVKIGKTIILEDTIDRDIARYLEGLGWELMVW